MLNEIDSADNTFMTKGDASRMLNVTPENGVAQTARGYCCTALPDTQGLR